MYTLQARKQMKATRLYDIQLDSPELHAREKASEPWKPFDFQTARWTLQRIKSQEAAASKVNIDSTAALFKDFDAIDWVPSSRILPSGSPTIQNAKIQQIEQDVTVANFMEQSRLDSESANKITPYIVQSGDTLYQIALDHGMKPADLLKLNPEIAKKKYIQPRDVIKVTGEKREVAQTKLAVKPTVASNPVEKPESSSAKLADFKKQIEDVNQILWQENLTSDWRTQAGVKFAELYRDKTKLEAEIRVQQSETMKQSTDYARTESIKNNGTAERQKETDALAKQTPNQKIVAEISEYFANLKAKPVNFNWKNYTEVQNYNKMTLTAEQDLKTAQGLVEDDKRITELEWYIAKNANNPAMIVTLDSKREIIAKRKIENDLQLAALVKSSTYASIMNQNKTTAT